MQWYANFLFWASLKTIVLTCRKLWCLSASHKPISSFTSFLGYYINQNFARCRIGGEILITISALILDYFQDNEKIFQKIQKTLYVPKCMSCHKGIVVINGRAYCDHDTYIYRIFIMKKHFTIQTATKILSYNQSVLIIVGN